jgi:hypothetical protein
MAGKQPGKDIVNVPRSSAGENGYRSSLVKWVLGLPVRDIQNHENEDRYCGEDTFVHD